MDFFAALPTGTTFLSMVTEGIKIIGLGVNEMITNPVVLGCIGVSVAAWVCKKAVRLIKAR